MNERQKSAHLGKSALKLRGFQPFQLIALREMLETFSLHELIERLVRHADWQSYWDKPTSATPTDDQKARANNHLNEVVNACADLNFDVADCVKRIRGKLEGKTGFGYTQPTSAYWMELYNRILNETNKHTFTYIPQDRVRYYEPDALFGWEVENNFPSASVEIAEASRCYALGMNTACVFHLMRCVEIGARSLVYGLKAQVHLSRPVQLCDWGDLVGAIQEGLKLSRVGSRTTIAKKERYEFYNQASAQFLNFKDAWRNNVAHTRTVYDEYAARNILENTRQFMEHLASRLKERR